MLFGVRPTPPWELRRRVDSRDNVAERERGRGEPLPEAAPRRRRGMAGRSAGRFRYCHSAKGKPVSEVTGELKTSTVSVLLPRDVQEHRKSWRDSPERFGFRHRIDSRAL